MENASELRRLQYRRTRKGKAAPSSTTAPRVESKQISLAYAPKKTAGRHDPRAGEQ